MNTIWGKSVNTFLTEVNFQSSSVLYAHQCFTSEAQRLKNMANISLLSSLLYRCLAYTSDTQCVWKVRKTWNGGVKQFVIISKVAYLVERSQTVRIANCLQKWVGKPCNPAGNLPLYLLYNVTLQTTEIKGEYLRNIQQESFNDQLLLKLDLWELIF